MSPSQEAHPAELGDTGALLALWWSHAGVSTSGLEQEAPWREAVFAGLGAHGGGVGRFW